MEGDRGVPHAQGGGGTRWRGGRGLHGVPSVLGNANPRSNQSSPIPWRFSSWRARWRRRAPLRMGTAPPCVGMPRSGGQAVRRGDPARLTARHPDRGRGPAGWRAGHQCDHAHPTTAAGIGLIVLLGEDAVRVEVHDSSPELPEQRDPGAWDDEAGRGLGWWPGKPLAGGSTPMSTATGWLVRGPHLTAASATAGSL
jgi:hypothetical protein